MAARRGEDDAPVSGGPTQTGSPPARADPADGPARRRDAFDGAIVAVVMTAAPVPEPGHETGLPCHGFITGIFALRPCTTCTATDLPLEAAGAWPYPVSSLTPANAPATSASTAMTDTAGTKPRGRRRMRWL